jgi:hypothetical protein
LSESDKKSTRNENPGKNVHCRVIVCFNTIGEEKENHKKET